MSEAALHLTVTRLQLRRTRPLVLARFLGLSLKNAHAARTSRGFITGALWVDARLTFWTVTLWEDGASMYGFSRGPVHLEAMAHLQRRSGAFLEAAFASGPTTGLPMRPETHRFLTAHATFYALPRPSADHTARRIRPPDVRTVRRLEALPAGASPL